MSIIIIGDSRLACLAWVGAFVIAGVRRVVAVCFGWLRFSDGGYALVHARLKETGIHDDLTIGSLENHPAAHLLPIKQKKHNPNEILK